MGARYRPDRAFEHSPAIELDACCVRDCGNSAGLVVTAGLGDLDSEDVRRTCGTRAGLADFKIGAMYWSMVSFMPSGLSAPYDRPPMVVPSPNPAIPSEQTILRSRRKGDAGG